MKKIVFYHVHLLGLYKSIVTDQLTKIFISGLYKNCDSIELYISSSDEKKTAWLLNVIQKYDKIVPHIIDDEMKLRVPVGTRESMLTLQELSKMASVTPGYYCYIHTKSIYNTGLSQEEFDKKEMWRLSMDYATIVEWEKNLEMLNWGNQDGFDAVGPNLRYDTHVGYHPHFSGTYWWTTHLHIRSLKDSYLSGNGAHLLEEFWIGSNSTAKLGSTFECGHREPYLIEATLDKYISI